VRIATGPRKQRGSERQISPLLALNAMLRDGRAWRFRAPSAKDGSCWFRAFHISTSPPHFIETRDDTGTRERRRRQTYHYRVEKAMVGAQVQGGSLRHRASIIDEQYFGGDGAARHVDREILGVFVCNCARHRRRWRRQREVEDVLSFHRRTVL